MKKKGKEERERDKEKKRAKGRGKEKESTRERKGKKKAGHGGRGRPCRRSGSSAGCVQRQWAAVLRRPGGRCPPGLTEWARSCRPFRALTFYRTWCVVWGWWRLRRCYLNCLISFVYQSKSCLSVNTLIIEISLEFLSAVIRIKIPCGVYSKLFPNTKGILCQVCFSQSTSRPPKKGH